MKKLIRFTPESLLARFVGRTFRDMITELAAECGFTLEASELEDFVLQEKLAVMAALADTMEPTVGSREALDWAHGMGYTMAVVTSSARDRVEACLKRAGQTHYFIPGRLFSAPACVPQGRGKPKPDIYEFGMDAVGSLPSVCCAVEDSHNGVIAAAAAKAALVIGYVGCYEEHEREEKAELLLSHGATLIMTDWSEFAGIMDMFPHITTLLLDYDNTLGLTETVAFTACCGVVNATLEAKGVVEEVYA